MPTAREYHAGICRVSFPLFQLHRCRDGSWVWFTRQAERRERSHIPFLQILIFVSYLNGLPIRFSNSIQHIPLLQILIFVSYLNGLLIRFSNSIQHIPFLQILIFVSYLNGLPIRFSNSIHSNGISRRSDLPIRSHLAYPSRKQHHYSTVLCPPQI
jgi:hypothetical protein